MLNCYNNYYNKHVLMMNSLLENGSSVQAKGTSCCCSRYRFIIVICIINYINILLCIDSMNELFVQYNDVYKCIVDPDESAMDVHGRPAFKGVHGWRAEKHKYGGLVRC